jgi:uncharacterized membrane protein
MSNAVKESVSAYHRPQTAEQLTAQNVRTIAELEKAAHRERSFADRVADLITRFCGSMAFVWVHVIWFSAWIVANFGGFMKPFDPFPFNFLTLMVSLEAIFLSTFILISENHQSRVDERRSSLDLQINLLSEQENTKMLQLLKEICRKLEIDPDKDPSVALLQEATQPEKLVEQITQHEAKEKPDAPVPPKEVT